MVASTRGARALKLRDGSQCVWRDTATQALGCIWWRHDVMTRVRTRIACLGQQHGPAHQHHTSRSTIHEKDRHGHQHSQGTRPQAARWDFVHEARAAETQAQAFAIRALDRATEAEPKILETVLQNGSRGSQAAKITLRRPRKASKMLPRAPGTSTDAGVRAQAPL